MAKKYKLFRGFVITSGAGTHDEIELAPLDRGTSTANPGNLRQGAEITGEGWESVKSPGTKIGKSAPDELHTRVNGIENPGKRARSVQESRQIEIHG